MTAVRATFSDFKIIKTRKVAQLVMEVSLEEANAALQILGGVPQPMSEQWVGIAPITQEAATPKPKKQITLAQRAGILCNDPRFQKFIGQVTPEGAAAYVRGACRVDSRSELDTNPAAAEEFKILMTEFDVHIGRIAAP